MQLNQRTFLALIRHKIFENLEEIQRFRHERLSIMYENTQKTQQNLRAFHNLQSHLTFQYIKICVLIRHTFCENLVKIYAIKLNCHSFFCIFFSTYIGQCFHPATKTSVRNKKILLYLDNFG